MLEGSVLREPKPCKIYDCDKREMIKACKSLTEAGNYLGLTTLKVNDILKNKLRNRSNKLGLTITIR